MTILWINLSLVFLFAVFSRYYAQPATIEGSISKIKHHKFLVICGTTVLVLVSGLRANIGDTFTYRTIYLNNEFNWEFISSEKDIGFGILQMILKNYISEDPQIMLFIAALITNVLVIFVFYYYSRMIELSFYVYITGGLFLFSMNGIRQMLAAAIAFTTIRYLQRNSFIKYALIVIFASLFHQSALILLPIYFLVRFKAWSKVTVILLILAVAIVFLYEIFSSLLFTALSDTQYANYDTFNEGGANRIRVIVEFVPLFFAYLGRDKLKSLFPESDFVINMALIGLIFMAVATQEWIFARVSVYFQLYNLILISWLPKLFRKRDQKLIYFGIIICYFLYYYFETVISLNLFYRSDYLIW